MEFRLHQKLSERIKTEQRDIALITAPGMGLSTLLKSLEELSNLPVVWLDTETIKRYWEIEYKSRSKNRRFVIHAATITALIESRHLVANITEDELFKTNLPTMLRDKSHGLDEQSTVFVAIDDFDELPDDLALIVCKELKALDDMRTQAQYKSLRSIRFVIGGAIDFCELFAGETPSGVSPATNFCKYRPYDFLLSSEEATSLLDTTFPELAKLPPSITQLVIDGAGGYLHYVLKFAYWILRESQELEDPSSQALIARLKNVVEEQDRIPLFTYCYSAWDSVQAYQPLVDLLTTAVSAGHVYDLSNTGRKLAHLGLVLEKPGTRNLFHPANRLVELFLRQRLAERGAVLPIEDSAIWTMPSLNARAYKLILEIETRLRNFIGDQIFAKYQNEWIELGLEGIKSHDGQSVRDEARKRLEQDQRSIYATPTLIDPFLTFLDFADLGSIVEHRSDIFPCEFATKLPAFLEELNYHRRRIAHNRPMTSDQIEALERRWQIIQRMMARHFS
ncbi:MAG: hypothetical protein WBW48_20250 [Anaerolineae bacterium]